MDLTAVLTPAEEGGYVALNPENGTTTQGETFEEAIANLKEATSLVSIRVSVVRSGSSDRYHIQHLGACLNFPAFQGPRSSERLRDWVLRRFDSPQVM